MYINGASDSQQLEKGKGISCDLWAMGSITTLNGSRNGIRGFIVKCLSCKDHNSTGVYFNFASGDQLAIKHHKHRPRLLAECQIRLRRNTKKLQPYTYNNWHIETERKWSTLRKRQFQIHFLIVKKCHLDSNFTKIVPDESSDHISALL